MAKTTLKPSRLQEPWILSSFWLLLRLVPPVMLNEDLTHHPTPSLEGALHVDGLILPSITLWSRHGHLPCLTQKELSLWASRRVGLHQQAAWGSKAGPWRPHQLHCTDHTEGKTQGWEDWNPSLSKGQKLKYNHCPEMNKVVVAPYSEWDTGSSILEEAKCQLRPPPSNTCSSMGQTRLPAKTNMLAEWVNEPLLVFTSWHLPLTEFTLLS